MQTRCLRVAAAPNRLRRDHLIVDLRENAGASNHRNDPADQVRRWQSAADDDPIATGLDRQVIGELSQPVVARKRAFDPSTGLFVATFGFCDGHVRQPRLSVQVS